MSITLPTTTVTVYATSDVTDGWDEPTLTPIGTEVPATISGPSGQNVGSLDGQSVRVDAILLCDFPALADGMTVADTEDGRLYAVQWASHRTDSLGLGHTVAGLLHRKGVA